MDALFVLSVAVLALVSIFGVAANSAARRLRWTVAIAFSIAALTILQTLEQQFAPEKLHECRLA